MWLLSFLSASVFVIPVFVTFGIYFGVEHQRILSCGFHCGHGGGGGFFPGEPGGTDITSRDWCQKSYAITPSPGRYVYNPNQWGDDGNTGSLCLQFQTDGQSGAQDYAASWAAIWNYTIPGPAELPVHAFPNAGLTTQDNIPVQLSSMTGLNIDVEWSYSAGGKIPQSTALDYASIAAADINANICVDMFMASASSDSQSTTNSQYEVMVWLGRFGPSTLPLGYELGALDTRVVSGTTFNLYSMANSLGQLAFTWLADQNTTSFKGNIGPLVHGLTPYSGPTPNDYLGYVAFGSEAFYATTNATFYVPKLSMDLTV